MISGLFIPQYPSHFLFLFPSVRSLTRITYIQHNTTRRYNGITLHTERNGPISLPISTHLTNLSIPILVPIPTQSHLNSIPSCPIPSRSILNYTIPFPFPTYLPSPRPICRKTSVSAHLLLPITITNRKSIRKNLLPPPPPSLFSFVCSPPPSFLPPSLPLPLPAPAFTAATRDCDRFLLLPLPLRLFAPTRFVSLSLYPFYPYYLLSLIFLIFPYFFPVLYIFLIF